MTEETKKQHFFWACMKNYISSLRYVFAALGVMFLALLIGSSIVVNDTKSALSTMATGISETTKTSDLSLSGLGSAFWDSLTSDANMETVESKDTDGNGALSSEEAQQMLSDSFETVLQEKIDNYTTYAEKIGTLITTAVEQIFVALLIFVLWQILGIVFANAMTQFFARMDVEHRNPLKVIGSGILQNIFIFIALLLLVYLLTQLPDVGIVLILCAPFVYCILSLISSNIVLGKEKRLPIKEVLRFRNIMILFLTNALILLISSIIGILIFQYFNPLIAVYINISLVIVAGTANSLNADVIVRQIAEKQE